MKYFFITLLYSISLFPCFSQQKKEILGNNIDLWHKAAGDADFESYKKYMTNDCVFVGTDATEYWKGQGFIDFAKPYFEKGKAWSFEVLKRNIYLSKNDIGWFDEILNTSMGVCRGSGVVVLEEKTWKIKHYVLSIAVPNENVHKIIQLNKDFDTKFLENLSHSKDK